MNWCLILSSNKLSWLIIFDPYSSCVVGKKQDELPTNVNLPRGGKTLNNSSGFQLHIIT